jgi:hypothetical protein
MNLLLGGFKIWLPRRKSGNDQQKCDQCSIWRGDPSSSSGKKAAKKNKKEQQEMPAPFDTYVALHIVGNMVKKPAEAMAAEIKEKVVDMFDDILTETGGVETFLGYLGDAEANVQCRKSANIPREFVDMLRENDIPFEEEEQQAARYIINPEILKDQDLLGKLAVALQNAPGLGGVEIIQKQLPEVKVKPTEETLRHLAKIKDKTLRRTLLDGITTIAFGQHKMPTKKALKVLEELDIFGE